MGLLSIVLGAVRRFLSNDHTALTLIYNPQPATYAELFIVPVMDILRMVRLSFVNNAVKRSFIFTLPPLLPWHPAWVEKLHP
jgi:hypothetical protein